MNIAILISNSDYIHENKLPACDEDLRIVNKIIESTGKFQRIIRLQNKKSNKLKEELVSEIRSIKKELNGSKINELFLYYSGHGLYKEEQFFYIPVDYNSTKHNTTSLSNNELDDLIKSLSPEMTVKIIDACESSQNYIKMLREEKEKYLQSTKGKFNNCYFLFSSLNNQSSYQDDNISDFTKAFVDALITTESNTIRYQDIASYIADEFNGNNNQTPFFVIQAELTEPFSEDLLPIKENLNKYYQKNNTSTENDIDDELIQSDLRDIIAKKAEDFITKDKALETIDFLKKSILNIEAKSELKDLYNMKIKSIDSISTLPGIKSLFKDIESQEKNLFVKIERDEEEYEKEIEVPRHYNTSSFSAVVAMSALLDTYTPVDIKTVTRKREIVVGFEQSMQTTSSGFSITLIPLYDNLNMYSLNVFFLFNKKDFLLYQSSCEYYDKDWGNWKLIEKTNWEKSSLPFNNQEKINNEIKISINGFLSSVYKKLKELYEKEV